MVISGPLADVLGVRFWYVLAAAACTLIGVLARYNGDIMSLDQGPKTVMEAAPARAD